MKAHAVPQEIMKVEFKLFGNFLSLREFIFIAVGLAIAYFFYFLMNNGVIPPLLAWPIILLIGGGGIIIALVPIEDRSLDEWIMNYFNAIKSPTQRVWKKKGFEPVPKHEPLGFLKKDYLVPPPQTGPTPVTKTAITTAEKTLDESEKQQIDKLNKTIREIEMKQSSTAQATVLTPNQQTPIQQNPTQQQNQNIQGTPVPNSNISQPPDPQPAANPQAQTQSQQKPNPQPPSSPDQSSNQNQPKQQQPMAPKPPITQQQPTDVQQPTQQSSTPKHLQIPPSLQKEINQQPKQSPTPNQPVQQKGASQQPTTLVIDDSNIGEFATDITGVDQRNNSLNFVVQDQGGQYIPQVTCIVKNQEGSPVRAAVSNQLGQIINNIPLPNGTYRIDLSKQGYTFPVITRTLTGKVYPGILIKSI